MKKNYVKPEIMFEDFSLSNSIAAGCEYEANSAQDMCGYKLMSGQIVFTGDIGGCDYTENVYPSTNGYYYQAANKICYHVPDAQNLFNSL